ncbi:hypothetical protein [Gymnodinialimonas hymeniacidonis]|uniref:hypothetical protein n=1 Tax=Gymnodinialimonas hymeniacidonis TaxID=3126508 RepID=UPI0034C62FFA
MDMSAPIAIDLPPNALAALRSRARAEQMSPATLAHKILVQALAPQIRAARTPERAEEERNQPLLRRLRALLADDLADASDWDDLQDRLAMHGYTLRERDGGIALYCTTTAARICQASDLSSSYADLIDKFGAAFPNLAQTELARRVLHRAEIGGHPDLFPDLIEDEGEVILIEDD